MSFLANANVQDASIFILGTFLLLGIAAGLCIAVFQRWLSANFIPRRHRQYPVCSPAVSRAWIRLWGRK